MQQEERIAISTHQKNIIASAIVALGFIVSASILAYFPGASRAQSQAIDARTLVNNPIYTNADGKC